MTATPIPRTLACWTAYGDHGPARVLDRKARRGASRSTDRTLPLARLEEPSTPRSNSGRASWRTARRSYCRLPLGRADSELLEVLAAASRNGPLTLKARFEATDVGLVHGKMKAVREGCRHGRASSSERVSTVLVATTVIEVGIDVPNATVMFIEDAERFGLAQLHQLRGRVGRGADQSYCVAFRSGNQPSERLAAFAATNDGFRLAEEDLRIRGQGDLFGKDQSGIATLRFADLERDRRLLDDARRRAREIVADDPELTAAEHAEIRRELEERYAGREALYQIG